MQNDVVAKVHIIYKSIPRDLVALELIKALIGCNAEIIPTESKELKKDQSIRESLQQEEIEKFSESILFLDGCKRKDISLILKETSDRYFRLVMQNEKSSINGSTSIRFIKYSDKNYFNGLVVAMSEYEPLKSLIIPEVLDKVRMLAESIGVVDDLKLTGDIISKLSDEDKTYREISDLCKINISDNTLVELNPDAFFDCKSSSDRETLRITEQRITELRRSVRLDRTVKDMGIKLSLLINTSRADKFQDRFSKRLVKYLTDGKTDFFTEEDVSIMYRRLDYNLMKIDSILHQIKSTRYTRGLIDGTKESILIANSPVVNTAIAYVLLRIYYTEFDNDLVVVLVGLEGSIFCRYSKQSKEYLEKTGRMTDGIEIKEDVIISRKSRAIMIEEVLKEVAEFE